jgi:hypothetical protein
MWIAIALAAGLLAAASIFLLASAWRLYRRDKRQQGVDFQVGQWLRDRKLRDVLMRRGPARLTYRRDGDGGAAD